MPAQAFICTDVLRRVAHAQAESTFYRQLVMLQRTGLQIANWSTK